MGTITFKGLCTNCEKETEFERVVNKEELNVKGELVTIEVERSRCKNCGDEVLDPTKNPDSFALAYREYRKKHGLLQPEDIRDWRAAHHLTQAELARLLGLGTATLNRYENGALQNESHERLLRLAMEPSNLLILIEKSEQLFSEDRKRRLLIALRESEENPCSVDRTILINFGTLEISELNGYKKLDLSKLYNAILFFAKDGVLKTKLNKLLFYSDFKHFKEYSISITGLEYAHLPYGPTPNNYEIYYASLASKKLVEFIEETYPGGYTGEVIKSMKDPDLNVFSVGELRIMASVKEDFKNFTATKIRDYSHKEVGYKETKKGESISYSYANRLNY